MSQMTAANARAKIELKGCPKCGGSIRIDTYRTDYMFIMSKFTGESVVLASCTSCKKEFICREKVNLPFLIDQAYELLGKWLYDQE